MSGHWHLQAQAHLPLLLLFSKTLPSRKVLCPQSSDSQIKVLSTKITMPQRPPCWIQTPPLFVARAALCLCAICAVTTSVDALLYVVCHQGGLRRVEHWQFLGAHDKGGMEARRSQGAPLLVFLLSPIRWVVIVSQELNSLPPHVALHKLLEHQHHEG